MDITTLTLGKRYTDQKAGYALNTGTGLRTWRAAIARLNAGANQIVNVCCMGDSITEGGVSGGGGISDLTGVNYPTKGYVGRVRSVMTSKFGDVGPGFIATYHPKFSPLWTFSAGWSDSTANNFGVTGFNKMTSASGETATHNFNGTGIKIYAGGGSSGGAFTASVDGGAPVAFDTNRASVSPLLEFSITGLADGAHTLTITSTVAAGKFIWLFGAYALKGTTGVRIHNVARWGTRAPQASVDTALAAEIDPFQPTLTTIAYTANDYTNGTDLATYKSSLQSIITRAKQYGDVMLISTGLRNDATGPIPQVEYNNIQRTLALQNDVAYLDIFNRWGANADIARTAYQFISTDKVHPVDYGHQDIASAILSVIDEY